MKVALFADIHANITALNAALRATDAAGIKEILVAGDLVGYYHQPAEVASALMARCAHVVRGNHEVLLATARRDLACRAAIHQKYGSGIDVALESLAEDQLDWLDGLPHPSILQLGGRSILLCHGSPWDIDAYLYPDAPDPAFNQFLGQACDVVVYGHTHYPLLKTIAGTLIINPGSVGQPRDRRPGAAWAALDLEDLTVTFHREDYDMKAVAADARRRDPHVPYLAEVLSRT